MVSDKNLWYKKIFDFVLLFLFFVCSIGMLQYVLDTFYAVCYSAKGDIYKLNLDNFNFNIIISDNKGAK